MTQLLEEMIEQLRQLSETEQNKIAQNVIGQIKEQSKNQSSKIRLKLSDDFLIPILESEEDFLFERNKDTGRDITL